MEDKNDIIRVNKDELMSVDQYVQHVRIQNFKIAELRKQQLYDQLKVVSESRVKASNNLNEWIDELASRIFTPEVMDKLTMKQKISLFKYLVNTNNKLIADTNHLDDVLAKHVVVDNGINVDINKADNEVTVAAKQENYDNMKADLLNRFKKMFVAESPSISEADIVNKEDSQDISLIVNSITKQASKISDKELEEEQKEIENDVKPLLKDKNIEYDISELAGIDEPIENNVLNEELSEKDFDELEPEKSDNDDDFELDF